MAVDAVAADELVDEADGESPSDTTDADLDAVSIESRDADAGGRGVLQALAFAGAAVVALSGMVGWQGFRVYESHQAQQQRSLLIQVARQAALNLTTIDYTEADADVQRVLDSSVGTFHDEFEQRAKPFIEVVKQAQSKSEGSIVESGLESLHDGRAQVLVAVDVKTSIAGNAQPQPRAWRMRITVQQSGNGAKVSAVQFVP